jgi:hypothetical protein
MLIEMIFCYALISATRTIAKIYDRRRDVLYGRYVAFDAAYFNSCQHRWSDDCDISASNWLAAQSVKPSMDNDNPDNTPDNL